MKIGRATENRGPNDGPNCANNIFWNKEEGCEDHHEEGNRQWTHDFVSRHQEPIWQEVS